MRGQLVGIRLTEEEMASIERHRKRLEKENPGLRVSQQDVVRMALAYFFKKR